MRASDRSRSLLLVAVLLLPLLTAARWRAPEVASEGPVTERVQGALRGQPRAALDVWMQRAWRALESGGWPQARLRADTLATSSGSWTLEVQPGPRTSLGDFELRGPDAEVLETWRRAAGLEPGDLLSPPDFDAALVRALHAVSDSGYALASVTVIRQDYVPQTGRMNLTLLVRPGPRARVREILVEGATRTRPEVLARLSGLERGDWVEERRLEASRQRLLARPGLVTAVDAVEVLRVPGNNEEVDLRLAVQQDPHSGTFSGALGASQAADGSTQLSGAVELALLDLFGTARSFRGSWRDDGRGRNRLDLAWLEPMIFKSGLDLQAAIGQRHEDAGYDMVLADLGLYLPAAPGLQLGVTGGLDRTTFLGEEGRTRRRNRAGVNLGLQWMRGSGSGLFGRFGSDFQAAFVSDRKRDPLSPDEQTVQATVRHSLIEADGRAGWAFSRYFAFEGRLAWHSTEGAPLPLPVSEQWPIGGATSVRGHIENQYFGERVAYGGLELVVGPARQGQAYLFLDGGWVRTTSEVAGVSSAVEHRLSGYGLGVRAPTALGAIDLGLGFADRLNFDEGKIHVALVQQF